MNDSTKLSHLWNPQISINSSRPSSPRIWSRSAAAVQEEERTQCAPRRKRGTFQFPCCSFLPRFYPEPRSTLLCRRLNAILESGDGGCFSWREKKWLSGLEQDGAGSAGKSRREDAAITIYYFRVLPSTDELLIPWQVFEFIFSSISQERRRQIFADFPAKHLHTIQNMKFLSFIILIPFPFHSLGNPLISPIFCIQLFNIV